MGYQSDLLRSGNCRRKCIDGRRPIVASIAKCTAADHNTLIAHAPMSEGRNDYLHGLASDFLFSFVTYCVLGTILGLCARLVHPEVEQVVGYKVASLWWLPIVLGYSGWQF